MSNLAVKTNGAQAVPVLQRLLQQAPVVACVVREVLTDEVTLRWVYEGGSPSTPVLSGDTPADGLARSRGL